MTSFLRSKLKENREFLYEATIVSILPVMRKYYDREEIEVLIAFYAPMAAVSPKKCRWWRLKCLTFCIRRCFPW